MAKLSFDDGDGVWRTVGGKHIFIRTGESLSSAMKRSGKFKNAKKKNEEKNWRDKLKSPNERDEILNRELDESTKTKAKDFWEKEDKKELELTDKQNETEKKTIHTQSGSYSERELKERDENIKQMYKDTWEGKQGYKELNDKLEELKKDGKISQGELDALKYDASLEHDDWQNNPKNAHNSEYVGDNKVKIKEIDNKIANNKTLTEEEFTKKIREIQSRPSYKQKMDEAVSELNKKYGEKGKNSNEKYSIDYFKQKGVEIKDSVPEGYVKLEGATTAPKGYEWYSNGKSRFGGEYKNALVKKEENGNQKYASAKHEGFGNYNKDNIPVYNNKIDYTGDFGRNADLSTLNSNELREAIRVQTEQLNKAKAERIGDQRTKNGRMDKIFNTAKVQQYEEGVKLLKEEAIKRENDKYPQYKGTDAEVKYYSAEDVMKDPNSKLNQYINEKIRRKAYQKYLKEHPASKITFEDFKDMRNINK